MTHTTNGAPASTAVNITVAERAGRGAVGLAVVVVGVILVTAAASVVVFVVEVLLVAAGVGLVVTGAWGHSPCTPSSAMSLPH